MEEFVIGDTPVGLWNFVDAIELQGAYERNELATKSSLTSVRLGGEGYITIDSRAYIMRERTSIGFKFKTAAKEGLMFLAYQDSNNFLSIELREGRILYQYNLGDGLLTLASDKTFNDDEWHSLEASRYHKDGVLKIDGDVVTKNQSPGYSENLEISEDIFVGGYPGFHKLPDVTEMDFDGCLDELQIDSTGVDMVSSIKNAHDMKQGCPKKFSGTISFDARARSYAKVASVQAGDEVIQVILRLKTMTSDGVIAVAVDGSAQAQLRMQHGVVVWSSGGAEVATSHQVNLADGQWHVVVATHHLLQQQLSLHVDDYDMFVSETAPKPIRLLHPHVYLGGVPSSEDAAAAIGPQFNGCLGDVTINGEVINFSQLTEVPGTTVGKCLLETPIFIVPKPPPPPPPALEKPEEKPEDKRPPAPPLITDSEEILEPDEVSDSPDIEMLPNCQMSWKS
ncbi:laminin subunit alpha-like [Nilaparvata lugens]|uniref:laminin subunit alpha-like n=1 Tax=Nilaparvata lugens TaxID=108931 RepID=UPI00193EA591|nr:laminin subunit alpha-like [Nilaparvata lugens]